MDAVTLVKPIHTAPSAADNKSVNHHRKKRKLTEIIVNKQDEPALRQNPFDYVMLQFKANGFDDLSSSSPSSLSFLKITESMIAGYKMDSIRAVRDKNLDKLKELVKAGESLQCCNRYGESLLHLACRRGHTDIVRFLVCGDAQVSPWIRDDFGRTPLHDAFWTPEPKFDLVELLIQVVPEFLLVKDVRGHTPLHYVRQHDWEAWCDFFRQRKSLLLRLPKQQQASSSSSDDDGPSC